MGDSPSIEEVADGLALWQEHKPRTLDDWKEIARRFSEEADGLRSQLEGCEQREARVNELLAGYVPGELDGWAVLPRSLIREALAALRSGRH